MITTNAPDVSPTAIPALLAMDPFDPASRIVAQAHSDNSARPFAAHMIITGKKRRIFLVSMSKNGAKTRDRNGTPSITTEEIGMSNYRFVNPRFPEKTENGER